MSGSTPPAAQSRPFRRRKRFGQHFLTDAATVERVFAALRLAQGDHVMEIGPGTGALTGRLVEEAAAVTAVEIDNSLAERLRHRFPGARIIAADALRTCWRDLLAAAGDSRIRLVGNLPYNVATRILAQWLGGAERVFDMHFMLQAEVAARLTAQPGGKAYGRLSVLAQHRCRVERLFDVPAASFSPPPKVHSAFVRLQAAPAPTPCDLETLGHVLRVCFAQRRKKLARALRSLDCDAKALQLDPQVRPEELSVGDFVAIANQYREAREASVPTTRQTVPERPVP